MISETLRKPPGINILEIQKLNIVDRTGIHISSNRAPQEFIKDIDFEMVDSPFPESHSRLKSGVQMSNLERQRLNRHQMQVLDIIGQFRVPFLKITRALTDQDIKRPLSMIEMRDLMRACAYFPHYLSLRATNPIQPIGELPPELIVLSNAANGTIAGLELAHKVSEAPTWKQLSPPDHFLMATEAEEQNRLVGEKSVCVAGPKQLPRFFREIIEGPQKPGTYNLSGLVDLNTEIMNMLVFGESAYIANIRYEELKGWDEFMFNVIRPKRHKLRTVRPEIESYMEKATEILGELTMRQKAVNGALDRNVYGPSLTLATLAQKGLETAKLANIASFR